MKKKLAIAAELVRLVKLYLSSGNWSDDALARFALKAKPLIDEFEKP